MQKNNINEVAIIGGGIGGTMAALKIAEHNIPVLLFEMMPEILSRTSSNTPGRMGHGYHYFGDKTMETAKIMIEAALNWEKHFPDPNYTIHDNIEHINNEDDKLKRGRYFIVKDSQTTKEEAIEFCNNLKKAYHDCIKERIEAEGYNGTVDDYFKIKGNQNKFFGPVETFNRIIEPREYDHIVNKDNILLGIETAERLVDSPKVMDELRKKIEQSPNITIYKNSEVKELEYTKDGFKVIYNHNNEKKEVEVKQIVNATWENRMAIDNRLGLAELASQEENTDIAKRRVALSDTTNRVKVLAVVELPESLAHENSMFFARGPFCMFTNSGIDKNGKHYGHITYAPITNQLTENNIYPSEKLNKLLQKKINKEDEQKIMSEMLNGVAKYIPEMKNAKVKELKFGVVQSFGDVDIYDPNSKFHIRDISGIIPKHLGYISLSTQKLILAPTYAEEICDIILKNKEVLEDIDKIQLEDKNITQAIQGNLRFYNDINEKNYHPFVVKNKKTIVEQLKDVPSWKNRIKKKETERDLSK